MVSSMHYAAMSLINLRQCAAHCASQHTKLSAHCSGFMTDLILLQ